MSDDRNPMTYWAAAPTAEAAQELWTRIDRWFDHVNSNGRLKLWRTVIDAYYAGARSGGEIGEAGEQGESLTIKVNHLRNIAENIVVMVTGSRPQFEPKATNSDHASSRQAQAAAGLLEAALREKGLEDVAIKATRYSVQAGEGWATATWNVNAGKAIGKHPDTGEIRRTGDLEYRAVHPLDVARDVTKDDPNAHVWFAVRRWRNAFDVASERPELADKILSIPRRGHGDLRHVEIVPRDATRDLSDDVAEWHFWHADTPSLPGGRYMVLLSADVVTFDGPLPYDRLPVHRLSAEDETGSGHGNSTLFDILAPQHAINAIKSSVLTNIEGHAPGTIWFKAGANVTVEQTTGGMKIVKGGTEPPVPLKLLDIPSVVPETEQQLVRDIEITSGVNAVRRGNPEAVGGKDMSGAAMALIDAKFVEFSAGIQRGYTSFMEAIATATIGIFKRYATAPQTIMMVGKSKRAYMAERTGADVQAVERVSVDLGSPLMRTASGRFNLVTLLAKDLGLIKTPEQILQVLATGRLDPVLEGPAKAMDLIRAENEALEEGKPVVALRTDPPLLHIQEHLVVLSSPEARENGALVEAVLMHVDEHLTHWMDPMNGPFYAAIGTPPPPMPMVPPGMPPDPEGGVEPMPGGEAAPMPGGAEMPGPAGPQMPVNPATGERAPAPAPMA